MPPATRRPDVSVPICPARKSRLPTRTAGENGLRGGPYGVRNSMPFGGMRALQAPSVIAAATSEKAQRMVFGLMALSSGFQRERYHRRSPSDLEPRRIGVDHGEGEH